MLESVGISSLPIPKAGGMDEQAINVLLVEDDPNDVLLLRKMLQKARSANFNVEHTPTLREGIEFLKKSPTDVVLLDLLLSDSEGLNTFTGLRAEIQDVPIIVLSGRDDEKLAVKAVQLGAEDYLVKGRVDGQLLTRAIRYAIERTQAKVALYRAEENYRSIYENSVEGIFQTTPDGKYLSANKALAKIYGYDTPEELIDGLTDISRLLYVDPNRRGEFIQLMQKHDVVHDFESRVHRKDGSIIWIAENVRAVRDSNNRLLYYEGTVEDITQRKNVEEMLRDSEALYHSLVETLPQNIFRKDLNERFTFANQRFCDTLGRKLEDIVGKTDFDFFPPEMAAKFQRDDHQVLSTGQPLEMVEENRPPGSNDVRYVQVVKTPLFDASGRIVGLQGIFWDITEKKKAESELARSQAELSKRNQMMEDDLKMAHEVQQAILPQQYPVFPRGAEPAKSWLSFCHRYHPTGAVGGDFFNVLQLSDTKAGLFICDVMGHGVRSALVTAMVRGLVEELKTSAADPGELLTRINGDLRAILQQTGTGLFTTAFYLVADLEAKKYFYANAGHPKPLLQRLGGTVEIFQNDYPRAKPALGLFQDAEYPTSSIGMSEGDKLLLFTDGLFEIEGPNETQFSYELLRKAVERRYETGCVELLDALLNDIKGFAIQHQFDDDVCLVGMEVKEIPKLESVHHQL